MNKNLEVFNKLVEGTFIKITGMKVKNDNDIFIVDADYRVNDGRYTIVKNERCLKKVKLNGELSNAKYNIVFLNEKMLNNNSNIQIEIITDLKKAKKEVNNYLKGISNNEIIVKFEKSKNQEVKDNSIVRFPDGLKFGMFGEKYIGSKSLWEVNFRNDGTIYIKELGKKGQLISTGRYFSCTMGLTKQILECCEVIKKIEIKKEDLEVKKEIKQDNKITKKENRKLFSKDILKCVDDVTNTIKELKWQVLNFQYNKNDNCIYADIKNKYGKITNEGIYAPSESRTEIPEIIECLKMNYTSVEFRTIEKDIKQERGSELHKDKKEIENNIANTTNEATQQQDSNNTININNNIQVRYNTDKNGIEVIFAEKPTAEILAQLKANGFRWSKYQKLWYTKDTQKRREFLKDILKVSADNKEATTITENEKVIDYPEIDINDIQNYIIDKELSKQENNNAMFRNKPRDHQAELQKVLQSANDDVIELLNLNCSKHIKYKAKQYLQSFKSKYYTLYKRILSHRAYNPSWMVTGRGGLNVSRYNKKQNQLTNMEKELCILIDNFNDKMEQFKNQIDRENEQKLREDIEKNTSEVNTNSLNLVKVKKKYNPSAVINIFNNPTAEIKGYSYNDQYYIFKNWGYWRIYDNEGNEVQLISRTTKSLEEAKKQLLYLLNQDNEKAV